MRRSLRSALSLRIATATSALAAGLFATACIHLLPELPRRGSARASTAPSGSASAATARSKAPDGAEPVDDFEVTLRARGDKLASYLGAAESLRLQVLFGEVVDDGLGHKTLQRHSYRLDADYFYPASAIKLCAAIAALEKITALRRTNAAVEATTTARFYGLSETATSFYTSSIGQEVRAALVISENDSYNRLFGFVGHRELNERMWALGAKSVRAVHRVGAVPANDDARVTGRVDLVLPGNKILATPRKVSTLAVPRADVAGLDVGTRHVEGGRVVAGPMPFANRNRVSLRDLQDLLIKVTHPELLPGTPQLELGDPERALLLDVLKTVPSESKTPYYTPGDFPDAVHKPFLPGLLKVLTRDKFALYSKGGMAYGFRTENAYIEGLPANGGPRGAFYLAVAMFADADGTVNDDAYDYAAVADPFLAEVAETLAKAVFGGALVKTR